MGGRGKGQSDDTPFSLRIWAGVGEGGLFLAFGFSQLFLLKLMVIGVRWGGGGRGRRGKVMTHLSQEMGWSL